MAYLQSAGVLLSQLGLQGGEPFSTLKLDKGIMGSKRASGLGIYGNDADRRMHGLGFGF